MAECECGHIVCVCFVARRHPDPRCRFRVSMMCPIGVPCEHGSDVCPQCDPCNCYCPQTESQHLRERELERMAGGGFTLDPAEVG